MGIEDSIKHSELIQTYHTGATMCRIQAIKSTLIKERTKEANINPSHNKSIQGVPPKELGGKVVVWRGQAAIRSTPFDHIRAARSSLLFLFYHLFILEVGVASLALVEPGSLEAVVRGPMTLRIVLVRCWIVLEPRVLE
ncbi:unnamed protein product [Microthlaspi erraticum]|uniref:Uncharacterized protein n=1 Tax=Microthlaspi erraticum TaxID=1685480 RepID=A0A6D2KHJ2_9BRAS|nr:unnamed protein product [Microthlaspi erraticum]